MANAKANIYPVQLQGAELNLNKFDAEIKQYSGFNKNNSPFIGGCLSNVFLKNEANATQSSDSVYVDDEGNEFTFRYNAGALELQKNGDRIIRYFSGTQKAWNYSKLDLSKNAIFYDLRLDVNQNKTAELWIEKAEDGLTNQEFTFIYHYKDFVSGRELNNYFTIYKTNDFDFKNCVLDKIFFDWDAVETYGISSLAFSYGYKAYIRDIVNNVNYVIMAVQPVITRYDTNIRGQVLTFNDNDYKHFSDFRFYENAGKYVLFHNMNRDTCLYFYSSGTFTDKVEIPLNIDFSSSVEDVTLWDNLGFSNVFINKTGFYVLSTPSQTMNYSNKRMLIYATGYVESVDITALTYRIRINSTATYLATEKTTLNINKLDMGKVKNAYWLRNWGCCYALKTDDNKHFWGVCDYLTNSVTLEEDSNGNMQPMFKMGAICSDVVLINNGFISGLSLPGGKILVADWNNVKDNIVVYYNSSINKGCIIYQDTNNDFYIVSNYADKPQLREINGMLVTNVNKDNNCYRLSDGKILTFAPAWNNRAPKDNLKSFESAVTDNNYYLASAINEYNLKDNASIILNPVPVIANNVPSVENFNSNNAEKYCINFYIGSIDSSEFLYAASSDFDNTKYFYNSDLEGLPFPLDTNGNVQYSPSLFCETFSSFGNDVFIKQGNAAYQLMKVDSEAVMSFYLGTLVEGLEDVFVIQGQYYGIINNQIFAITFANGVVQSMTSIVSTVGLQFCGNSPYMAIFFSKTNRCLYSFTGANVLNKLQFVDKISEIKGYKYNPATQSIFLLTDIGLVISSLFGMYSLESQWNKLFVYDKGIALVNDTNITWLEYYAREGFEKQLIELETCFYGMNNQTVTINDCLYVRLFSEEHEEGSIKVTATTISNSGRKTEQTEFKIKKSDWDKLTDSIYLRYQPKEQRGLGISFSISSPFKIASLSIGSQADAILIDKVSKGAINAPQVTSSNIKW